MGGGYKRQNEKKNTQDIASGPKIENPDFLDLWQKSGDFWKWAENRTENRAKKATAKKKRSTLFWPGVEKKVVDFSIKIDLKKIEVEIRKKLKKVFEYFFSKMENKKYFFEKKSGVRGPKCLIFS